jgi:hypothetical protein
VPHPSSSPSLDKSLYPTLMNSQGCCSISADETNCNDNTDCGNAGCKWVTVVSDINVDGSDSPNCQA